MTNIKLLFLACPLFVACSATRPPSLTESFIDEVAVSDHAHDEVKRLTTKEELETFELAFNNKVLLRENEQLGCYMSSKDCWRLRVHHRQLGNQEYRYNENGKIQLVSPLQNPVYRIEDRSDFNELLGVD